MSDEYIQIGWARINDRGDIYDLRKHKPVADNLIEIYIKKLPVDNEENTKMF